VWARTAEEALDFSGRGKWRSLFAAGATFSDPATTTPTSDLRDIQGQTGRVFPDWRQEITSIRGGDDWAVFEWIGRATYTPPEGPGVPVEMHGATIVEVDASGLVTSWRDYLDRKEPEDQIRAAFKRSGREDASRERGE
jgi:hypothetical protein